MIDSQTTHNSRITVDDMAFWAYNEYSDIEGSHGLWEYRMMCV